MKIRYTLTAIAAAATLTLTACGNDTPAAPNNPLPGSSTSVAATGSDDATTSDKSDEATTDESTTDENTSGETTADGGDDSTAADPTAAGDCAGLVTLIQDFTDKILKKATTGEVTQADVDAVFTDDVMASIPDDFKADVEKLKSLSQELVGKSITDASSTLTEISSLFQGLSSKVTGGSCS